MARSNDYMYGVIELVDNGKLNQGISHWVFKTITEANAWKEKMQAVEPITAFEYVVVHLNKR
jgi:hypothetical protein